MLKKIFLSSGSGPGKSGLSFDLTPITVFVGPNNSGKSIALAEIEDVLCNPAASKRHIVKSLELEPWSPASIEAAISQVAVEALPHEQTHPDHVWIGRLHVRNNSQPRLQLHKPSIFSEASDPNLPHRNTFSQFLSFFTIRLDGKNRLSLIDEQQLTDMQLPPSNPLAFLFFNGVARAKIRKIVLDAFGKYLVLDPTNPGRVRMRLSARAPIDESEERGWDSRSIEFHSRARLVASASDGVKAFVGILTSLIAGNPRVTLLDEPEAFLHPTLAMKLGREISVELVGSDRRTFVATHSAAFLMGCVQSGVDVNIVRLTYDFESATARLLSKELLTPLMRNPLLRSLGVFNALFYSAVIVTEGDADRSFYQEINERLLAANDPRGIEGCLFLNAQNKQTIWSIVEPLRRLGIPAVGIVDIDVIKEGGSVWKKPMDGAFVPAITKKAFTSQQQDFWRLFKGIQETEKKDFKRHGGINLLDTENKEACQEFFNSLAKYGIFVVPGGEVEQWLSTIDLPSRNKDTWLSMIFEKMGEDVADPSYVRPSKGDVWDFLGQIKGWVSNPDRLGQSPDLSSDEVQMALLPPSRDK